MAGRDHARRLALLCALAGFVIVASPAFVVAQVIPQTMDSAEVSTAREAARVGLEWLGPHPHDNGNLDVHRPIWQGQGSMFIEQQMARRVIRSWWPSPIADAKAEALLTGFALYLQSRVVERVFDQRYLRLAHHVEIRSYFGDQVIWSFPTLRLSRQSAVSGDRYAEAFASLERWIGENNLQGAMFEVARLPVDRLTADTIVRTMSNAAGQDLSWLFDATDAEVSYAVTALTPTSVTVARKGAGMFTGRSDARIGDFESGDAVRLKVVFENGETAMAAWDGRDQSRTFQFQGPSPLRAAYLDPDGIITLDRNRLDNAIVPSQPTNAPVRKWVARWVVWLQHTMLSYGLLA